MPEEGAAALAEHMKSFTRARLDTALTQLENAVAARQSNHESG
jgi:hypothetical protein